MNRIEYIFTPVSSESCRQEEAASKGSFTALSSWSGAGANVARHGSIPLEQNVVCVCVCVCVYMCVFILS